MAPLRATLIWNPTAGLGRRRRLPERVQRYLGDWATLTCVRTTEARGDSERFAHAIDARETDLLLIAGGDGTVNRTINGLTADVAVGILPTGTANVLALELRLPVFTVRAMVTALRRAEERRIDVGVCNGRKFLAMASAGFDAAVVREIGRTEKEILGPTAFALHAMGALPGTEAADWRIVHDGEVLETRAMMVLASNAARYGGPLRLSPGASLDDGWLDASVFRAATGAELVAQTLAILTRRPEVEEGLLCFRCQSLTLEATPPQPIQVDGESFGTTPARIAVLPRALRVLAPGG